MRILWDFYKIFRVTKLEKFLRNSDKFLTPDYWSPRWIGPGSDSFIDIYFLAPVSVPRQRLQRCSTCLVVCTSIKKTEWMFSSIITRRAKFPSLSLSSRLRTKLFSTISFNFDLSLLNGGTSPTVKFISTNSMKLHVQRTYAGFYLHGRFVRCLRNEGTREDARQLFLQDLVLPTVSNFETKAR